MKLTLYHYVHCPFCVRVRMALGYLDLPCTSVVVPYDDEETPVKLCGQKMLPIMEIDGVPMNESLDIIHAIDKTNLLQVPDRVRQKDFADLTELLNRLGSNVHNLAMPYWIYSAEFSETARLYFQAKKEQKRGPFAELVKRRQIFEQALLKDFSELTQELKPFFRSESFTLYDILLAAHLWGLYVVPEFQFPSEIHSYLQRVKQICEFNYHKDFWFE